MLQGEVDNKLALFTEMDEKLSKLRIAQAGNVGSVQILDDAFAPRKPRLAEPAAGDRRRHPSPRCSSTSSG